MTEEKENIYDPKCKRCNGTGIVYDNALYDPPSECGCWDRWQLDDESPLQAEGFEYDDDFGDAAKEVLVAFKGQEAAESLAKAYGDTEPSPDPGPANPRRVKIPPRP